MHEFAIDTRRDALCIGADLFQTIAAKTRQGFADGNIRVERELACVHRLPWRGARQCIAALGLARPRHRHRQIRSQR